MTAVEKGIVLSCPVCLEEFDDVPKVLTCGHSFCGTCVTQLQKAYLGKRMICPTCRKECTGSATNYIIGEIIRKTKGKEEKNKPLLRNPFQLEAEVNMLETELRSAKIRTKDRDFWYEQYMESLTIRQKDLDKINDLKAEIARLKSDKIEMERKMNSNNDRKSSTSTVSSEESEE